VVSSAPEDAPAVSAASSLRARVERDRARIAAGERPVYTVVTATSIDGSVDVTIRELPLIHLFVPVDASALDGARLIIARALEVDPASFDIHLPGTA
jgi:hypothetical protein